MFVRWILLMLAPLALLTAPARAVDKAWEDCQYRVFNADSSIAACTRVLARGVAENRERRLGAFLSRGYAYDGRGDYDRAIADYNEAIRLDPKEAVPYRARAMAFKGKGDLDHAIADYSEAIRLDPEDASNYSSRAEAYLKKGDYDRAIADYSEVIRLPYDRQSYSSHSGNYSRRADAYVKKGDYDSAIADYSEAIRLGPEDAGRYSSRAEAYLAKGGYDRAIADYREATRLDPDVFNFAGLTEAYLKNNDYDRAIADFSEFIRLDPKNMEPLSSRAQTFYMKGDYDRAVADLNEAIRIAPENGRVRLYVLRFHIYARKNEFENAFADIESISRFGLKDEQARAMINSNLYAFRAYVFGRMGQIDRAFAEIGEAFKPGADEKYNSLTLLYRGELHLMKGDARAALADFDASLAKKFGFQSRIYAHAGRDAALKALAAPQPPAAPSATFAQPIIPPATPLVETRVALVIGNARYAAQSPLKNPGSDAATIAGALRDAGFRKVVSASDLTRDALVKALQAFQDEADRADWAVIYFSGHGIEIGGVNYVVPTDARLLTDRNAPDEAVSLDRLMASVGGAHKLRIVILDACRDNPFVASMRRTIASRSAGKGLAPVEPTRATLVVYAARDGQLAQDGSGDNSPFAAALARRLGEPHVEVSKLFRLVTDDVLDATGRAQQPFVYGSLPGREDFYFRP